MYRRHKPVRKDLFWFGFLVGVVLGGMAGMILGTEVGNTARRRLEIAAQRVRSRFNGTTVESEKHRQEKDVENPT